MEETSSPQAGISFPAGPLTGAFPIIGLTATTFFFFNRSFIPGREIIGPILVIGLLGPIRIFSSFSKASSTLGEMEASETPLISTPRTSGSPRFPIQKSWKCIIPSAVSI